MDSRIFIKEAKVLIKELKDFTALKSAVDLEFSVEKDIGMGLEHKIGSMYKGLENPTLPSAFKLRDAAREAGCYVNPDVLRDLANHEYLK